jgi:hypothetical protein
VSSSSSVTTPPTQLTVTNQPMGAQTGSALASQPVVQIRDANNQLVAGATTSVTAAIASGSGTLSGATMVSAVGGVATFTNLVVTGPGTYTLRFTASGLASATSNSFTITAAPVSSPGNGTPFMVEDFSTYTSTSNFLSDPRGIYQAEDMNTGQITLDTGVGYGSSTKSMRYDYPDRTSQGGSGTSGRCTDYSISRSLKFPNNGNIREVWVELMVKTSTNFTTQAPASWGCTSDQGLKFVDGNVTPGDRFSIGLRTGPTPPSSGQLWYGYPWNQNDNVGKINFTQANAIDGNWHQYRCYWRLSTGYPGVAKFDGALTCWFDGAKIVDEQNIQTTSTLGGGIAPSSFYGLALGRNINQGPDRPQSIWWGQVKIYQSNPGW